MLTIIGHLNEVVYTHQLTPLLAIFSDHHHLNYQTTKVDYTKTEHRQWT